jgi:hypothetical protein
MMVVAITTKVVVSLVTVTPVSHWVESLCLKVHDMGL